VSASTGPTSRTFRLPDLGEGLTEAEVVRWHVAVDDEVKVDQIVVTVETNKATVDLPCPYAGRVLTLDGPSGGVVQVGKPLLTIGVEAKSVPSAASGSGSVLVGYGTSEARPRGRRRVTPAAPALAPRVISPVVRKLARDNRIDLSRFVPTGPGGVIRRSDVEAALNVGETTSQAGAARADGRGDIRIPLRGLRKAVAENVTISRREIPEVTVWVDVDATALLAARDEIRGANDAAGIGVLALLARISIAGLKRFPELNSRVDAAAREIVQLHDVNLGFAVQSPRGVVVPVVHHADEMTTTELATCLRDLTALARDGELSPGQLQGGTFTLNNYGLFGIDGATPIINYPEAAMLGVGRIIDRPWAYEGQLALRKVAQLGLTFDHRVCDGAAAGGFLRFVADCVERPAATLAFL
jgi:pyruvate dehydrogenase E2 component (dihydrolipoamide acetyltransferase)